MNDSLKLGRIAGVRVGANWSLLVLGATVAYIMAKSQLPAYAHGYQSQEYWAAGVATAVALLVGVLVHELAHALVARRAKLQVDGITLWFMGGVTRIEGDTGKPSTELLVSLVGPLASAGVGLVSIGFSAWAHVYGWQLATASLQWLGLINILLGVFNLLPAAPLDGGRVLHGLVWLVSRNRWLATRVASWAGLLLGAVCAAGGWLLLNSRDLQDGVVLLLMAWFVISSSKKEALAGRAHHVLGDVQVSDIMRRAFIAPGWLTVDTFWSDWVVPYPEAAFLLERWGGGDGWAGVVTAQQLASVPPNLRRTVRARDVALPLPAQAADNRPTPLGPDEPALAIAGRAGTAILIEDKGTTVGVVLAPDIAAMVARGTPAQRRTWASLWAATVPPLPEYA